MNAKWQPVMLVAERRLECHQCGALAVFVVLEVAADGDVWDYTAWCQDCWQHAQESDDTPDEERAS